MSNTVFHKSGLQISPGDSQLIVIDIQERLGSAMPAKVLNRVIQNTRVLSRAAQMMAVPIVATEQYPQGLGSTVAEVMGILPPETSIIEKTAFSAYRAAGMRERLSANGRRQIIVVGMEAHVCVLQTALDLLAADYEVFVVEDAVCSRRLENYQNALERLRRSGVSVVSAESTAFEWLEDATHPAFKEIQALLR